MGDNPYHDQHIVDYTAYVDDSNIMMQQHYDGILMGQNEAIESLVRRVERLEQQAPAKRQLFEVDVVATKDSLRRLRDAILGIFR